MRAPGSEVDFGTTQEEAVENGTWRTAPRILWRFETGVGAQLVHGVPEGLFQCAGGGHLCE